MRYNLLKMVQLIMASMDSDEVDDIFDTVESRQVVDLIEQTYNDICSTIDFPDHWDLFELQPSNDITRPTLMYLPANCTKVEWIQYNSAPDDIEVNYREVCPLPRKKFFDRMRMFDSDKPEVYRYDYTTTNDEFDIRGRNNLPPTYYTTVDNRTLIFDDFDLDQGQTLQGGRTRCYGQLYPMFERLNEFVADFEPKQWTLYFNEAKALCFAELKQTQNQKAEQRARRGWVQAARKKENTDASAIKPWKPNFGRK